MKITITKATIRKASHSDPVIHCICATALIEKGYTGVKAGYVDVTATDKKGVIRHWTASKPLEKQIRNWTHYRPVKKGTYTLHPA